MEPNQTHPIIQSLEASELDSCPVLCVGTRLCLNFFPHRSDLGGGGVDWHEERGEGQMRLPGRAAFSLPLTCSTSPNGFLTASVLLLLLPPSSLRTSENNDYSNRRIHHRRKALLFSPENENKYPPRKRYIHVKRADISRAGP